MASRAQTGLVGLDSGFRIKIDDLAQAVADTEPSPSGSSRCWGGQLSGYDLNCDPAFVPTGPHFKQKFCVTCQALGVFLPINRVRALPGGPTCYANRNGCGLWTRSAAVREGGRDFDDEGPPRKRTRGESPRSDDEDMPRFRVVNHTAKCVGPRLVVFRDAPIESGDWAPLPADWLQSGILHLLVSKGTLAPAALKGSSAKGSPPRSSPTFQVSEAPLAMPSVQLAPALQHDPALSAFFDASVGARGYPLEEERPKHGAAHGAAHESIAPPELTFPVKRDLSFPARPELALPSIGMPFPFALPEADERGPSSACNEPELDVMRMLTLPNELVMSVV